MLQLETFYSMTFYGFIFHQSTEFFDGVKSFTDDLNYISKLQF